MIVFLYGEDKFRISEKLKQLKKHFYEKNKSKEIFTLDGENINCLSIDQKLKSQSLFTEKKLIIIYNIFKNQSKTLFTELLELFNSDKYQEELIIFVEDQLKLKKNEPHLILSQKEKKFTKSQKELFLFLKSQKYSLDEFKKLNKIELNNWILQNFLKDGFFIKKSDIEKIVSLLGDNLEILTKEIKKLKYYKDKSKEIKTEDLKVLSSYELSENIFNLTDALGTNNKNLFLKILENQLLSGINELYLLTMIYRHLKIIFQVKFLYAENFNQKDIIAILKLHPFVLQKAMQQSKNFSLFQLKNYLNKLLELDYKIKIGQGNFKLLIMLIFNRVENKL